MPLFWNMIRKFCKFSIFSVMVSIALVSCIHNDIPYPKITQYITDIVAVGESSPADIDDENLSVTIHLPEDADIKKVRFSDFQYTEGAEVSIDLLEGEFNLENPLEVTLSKYQDYVWTISAVQSIERYFTVAGQIGDSEIDVDNCSVIIRMPKDADLAALEITSVKLGPKGASVISPDLKPGMTVNLSSPLKVSVTAFGESQQWTITALHSSDLVSTVSVDAWSCVIWAYGTAPENSENGFQYRKLPDGEWIDVDKSYVTHNGGSFSARIPHLAPLTDYEVRAVSGSVYADAVKVSTDPTRDLVDGSFDQWWLKDNKIWFPYNQNGEQFWDTGNTGAATLGQSNVTPSDFVPNGASGQAAKLETKFVGIGPFGKLAAGSIFIGEFKKVDGTNGILGFGRPWTLRPTKLRGFMSYQTATINYASSEWQHLKGKPDMCCIYIALIDSDEPIEIRTNPKNRKLFDKDAPEVIAYGEIITDVSTDGYVPFEIQLDYRSTSRRPKYIIITCAASRYGDFFTGGTGATLYVDQFSLDYDY